MIAEISASDRFHPRSVCGVGLYVIWPSEADDATRTKLPVGGGGPKDPSLPSSVIASSVSHDGACSVSAFLSTPNHPGLRLKSSTFFRTCVFDPAVRGAATLVTVTA